MTLSDFLKGFAPVVIDAAQIYESPGTTQAQQADAVSRIEGALTSASPKVAQVVNAVIPLGVEIAQHPNPGQLMSAGFAALASFLPTSFSF